MLAKKNDPMRPEIVRSPAFFPKTSGVNKNTPPSRNGKKIALLASVFVLAAASGVAVFRVVRDAGRTDPFVTAPSLQDEIVRTDRREELQVPFIKNEGQVEGGDVSFYAPMQSGNIYVSKSGLTYSVAETIAEDEDSGKRKKPKNYGEAMKSRFEFEGTDAKRSYLAFSETFLDRNGKGLDIDSKGSVEAETKVSFFHGKDRDKWKKNISSYGMLSLGELYNRIDVKLHAYANNVEKLFFVFSGGDPGDIALRVDGVEKMTVSDKGELVLESGKKKLAFTKPVAYQENEDKTKTYIAAEYVVKDGKTYGFRVDPYDHGKTLVIDPLVASTFLGGSADDRYGYDDFAGFVYTGQTSMARDASGNVYVLGHTKSAAFPATLGAWDETYNDASSILKNDVTVSKFNADLTQLLASTFLGGTSEENGSALALDSSGNVFVTGFTRSSDFPTTSGSHDTTYNGGNSDVFVSKLSGDLTSLQSSSFIGGSDKDFSYSLVVDGSSLYVFGDTYSGDFPVRSGAYQNSKDGPNDAFVSRMTGDLATMTKSTYLGGSSYDFGRAILKDGSVLVLAGNTESNDFPTVSGAYDQSHNQDIDAYVSILSEDLSAVSSSTFVGGSSADVVFSLAKDSSHSYFLTGTTLSSDFPTVSGSYDRSHNGGYDVFLSKLGQTLSTLEASTFLGGAGAEEAYAVVIDGSGNAHVSGESRSNNYPTTADAFDNALSGTSDGIFAKFANNLATLQNSSYFGGSSNLDYVLSIAHDGNGHVYAFGITESGDFPTVSGSYDTSANAGRDMFVARLTDDFRVDAYPDHLVVTDNSGSNAGSMQAGGTFTVKVTMKDPYGRTATTYSGDRNVVFSGAGVSLHGHQPTCTNKNGTQINFGANTLMTFANGEATCTMRLYRAENNSVDAAIDAYHSQGSVSYDLDMTVTKNALSNAGTSISASPSPATVTNSVSVTVTAKDAYGNPQGTDGAGKTVTIAVSGTNPGTPTVTDNGDGTYLASYTANAVGTDQITGSIEGQAIGYDTDGTPNGTFNETINSLGMDHFEVRYENPANTFNSSISANAGTSYAMKIFAKDSLGNTVASYAGSHPITMSGANASPYGNQPTCGGTAFGTPTSLSFTSGVATCTLILYARETVSIDASDGTFTSNANANYDLDATVAQTAITHLKIEGNTSQTAGNAQTITLSARDQYGNTVPTYAGDKNLTFSGANGSRNGTTPKATDKNNVATNFGTATAMTFSNGSATSSMTLSNRETAEIEATDGTYGTTASPNHDLNVAVSSTGTIDYAQSSISVSQDPAGTCGSETVFVTARDQYGNQLETGGQTTIVTITGSNPATPGVTDTNNGRYVANYSPSSGGNDQITATIDSNAVGSDDDGTSDGTYDLVVSAGAGNTRNWTGTVSTNWATASNWSENLVPDQCSTVNINTNTPNAPTLDLNAGSVTVADINLGASGTATLTLSNGGDTKKLVVGDDFTIGGTGTLTHTANSTAQTHRLFADVGGDLTINTGGKIDVSGKGYANRSNSSGAGPGGGAYGGNNNYHGAAGYGGQGGSYYGGTSYGATYGSVTQPFDLGSSGACWITSLFAGGGGAVRLNVSGTAQISGSILANGTTPSNDRCGGSSGGSVNIVAGTITGSGTVAANGSVPGYTGSAIQGSGGGGRIAFLYGTNDYTGAITAYGNGASFAYQKGGAGTVYTKADSATYGDVVVDNNNTNGLNTVTASSDTFQNMTIRNGSKYVIAGSHAITLNASSMTTTSNASMTINGTGTFTANSLASISNFTLTLNSGGTFTANSLASVNSLTFALNSNATANLNGLASITGSTITNNATLNLPSLATFDDNTVQNNGVYNQSSTLGPTLTVDNGSTWYENGNSPTIGDSSHQITDIVLGGTMEFQNQNATGSAVPFDSITINSGGNLTHQANGTTQTDGLNLALQTLTINSGGKIDVSGKGYAGEQGPGKGLVTGGGGAHGGNGGYGLSGSLSGSAYGSVTQPVMLGSGGAYAPSNNSGGGAVKVIVSGTATLNGQILSNGNTKSAVNWSGGGSGGSVWLAAGTFSGSGGISVNGMASSGSTGGGGGGAGGRIAIYYDSRTYSGSSTAYGGSGYGGSGFTGGGAGTIYTKANSATNGDLLVDNNNVAGAETPFVPLASPLAIQTLTVRNQGKFQIIKNSDTLAIDTTTIGNAGIVELKGYTTTSSYAFADMTIQNGGTLRHADNSNAQTNILNFSADNLTIDAGGQINVNGLGYDFGQGPGAGTGTSGGGFGGNGGNGSTGSGGSAYGTISEPINIGSGGGNGGSGGGAVKMRIGGTLLHNGTITANGTTGSAGGSGGSVLVVTDNFDGTGLITANGANGTPSGTAGGGGGGRVAAYYQDQTYVTGGGSITSPGTIQDPTGGTGLNAGGIGTLHLSYPDHYQLTGNGTQTAGTSQTVTVTLIDNHGSPFMLTQDRSFAFSGADATSAGPDPYPNGWDPTMTDKNNNTLAFGGQTLLALTDGVASTTMYLYKAQNAQIDATDGVFDTNGDPGHDLDVDVTATSASPAQTIISATPNPVTSSDSAAITVTAKDAYANALSTSAGTVAISIAGTNPETPTVTDNGDGTYAAGHTPTMTGTDLITGTLNGTSVQKDTDGNSDGTFNLIVTGGSANHLEVTGSGSQIAGEVQTIAVTAKDNSGNVDATYEGDIAVTFSGAQNAPDGTQPTCRDKNGDDIAFGTPTVLRFENGSATCQMFLYKAQSAAIDADGSTIDSFAAASYDLDVNVSAGPYSAGNSLLHASPNPAEPDGTVSVTVTARDAYFNTTASGGGSVVITVSGVNPNAPSVTDNGNGTYSASYVAQNVGFDEITSTIDAQDVSHDTDGIDDGTYRLTVGNFDRENMFLNLDINATIAISCDSSVAMNAIVGTGKSDITLSGNNATNNTATCNVKTNASSGYKMEWNSSATHEASGALKSMTNATDTISPYSLSGSSETWSVDATASEWGAKLGASSEGYGTGDAGGDYSYASAGGWGTNDGYTGGGKWMNVPVSPFQIMQKSTETDVDGEYQYLVFGAEIGADKLQPTGTYTQEVTVTATTL